MTTDVHEMRLRWAALIAFVAMCVADVAGTTLVIAEAHYNAYAAMGLDELCWLAGLACTVFGAGDLIRERRITRRVTALALSISAGNLLGTWLGVAVLGHLLAH